MQLEHGDAYWVTVMYTLTTNEKSDLSRGTEALSSKLSCSENLLE